MPDRDDWRFIYDDIEYPNLPQYPEGYYLNIKTKAMHSFKEGISDIIGNDGEMHVYNLWWFEQ